MRATRAESSLAERFGRRTERPTRGGNCAHRFGVASGENRVWTVSICRSVCLFVMARGGKWQGGISQIDDDVPLGHAMHVLVHAQGGGGAVQGVAAESHGGTDSSTPHSPELAAASREQRQLGGQVKSSFSMNVVGEDKEKLDSTGSF